MQKCRICFLFPSSPVDVWICVCVCADREALRLRVCRYQGCFCVIFLGLSLIDLYFSSPVSFSARFCSLSDCCVFYLLFLRYLHHSLVPSYKNHYSSRANTPSHSSWIRSSCRQENKSQILLNDYNIHHFSICNNLHSVINTAKWVTNRISCSALWAFKWRLLNWVISGNKNGVKPVLSSWACFCQIKPETLKQRIVGMCLKCFIRFEEVTVMHLLVCLKMLFKGFRCFKAGSDTQTQWF